VWGRLKVNQNLHHELMFSRVIWLKPYPYRR